MRPPTNLEYEKACRGPRAFAREEDAWAADACAPAAGLPVVKDPSAVAAQAGAEPAGASYWGIRQLSLSGCVHEWPGTIGNGVKTMALDFKGRTATDRRTSRQTGRQPPPLASGSTWPGRRTGRRTDLPDRLLDLSVRDRAREHNIEAIDGDRTGRYGARAVRTAPVRLDPNAPLKMERLPRMAGYDVVVFPFSGTFKNTGDKPLRVELAAPLPDACFPEGAGTRALRRSRRP